MAKTSTNGRMVGGKDGTSRHARQTEEFAGAISMAQHTRRSNSGSFIRSQSMGDRPAVAKFGILGFIAWAFMFSNIPQSFFLPIVVPCFIAAFCCVPITGIMKKGLLLLGKNSTYMWLTHSWLIYKFLQPVIFSMHDVVANLIVLVITDLPVAFCFKSLEGKVNKLLSDKCSCVTQ